MPILSFWPLKQGFNIFVCFLFLTGSAGSIGCEHRQESKQYATGLRDSSVTPVNKTKSEAAAVKPDTLKAKTQTVDEILQSMTLPEKIGQLFFIRARGYFLNDENEEYQDLVDQINHEHIGGIIFFKGNVYGQAVLTNKLQQISKIPLWITQDMEFGAAMRIEGTTRITPAMGIGASRNPNNAYLAGKITGQEAKALGVNQIFAPDLDVNNNPRNPVINVRSFSGDPNLVAEMGTRFIEGVASEGVISTGKHFPGHGDTDTDSHLALPVINSDYARLDSVELVPFKAAVDDSIPSIMSAHISFPKISRNPGRPGTLDKSILNRILVDSLGFKGLVITDGLEMSGISAHYSPGEAVVLALKAGADIMLLSADDVTAIHEVEQAVHDGKLTEARINRSVRKLLVLKKRAGLFQDADVDIKALSSKIRTKKNQVLADKISRESLTLLRNDDSILPIRAKRFPHILVLSVADDNSGETGSYLAGQMRQYHPSVRFDVFDRRTGSEEERTILRDARWANLIVIGSYVYVNSHSDQQFSDRQLHFLKRLPEKTPKAILALGNPYVVHDMPNAGVQLLAWDDSEQQVRNTVPALFGETAINGQLPIRIPGQYPLGAGIHLPQSTLYHNNPEMAGLASDSLENVRQIMEQAISDSTFPGGVVAVVKDGVLAYQKAFGYQTYDKVKKILPGEVYDLASLTKVVATTPSIMKLVDEGKVHLGDPVSKYFPEFKVGEKSKITVRELLLHTSGLPPFKVYVDKLKTRAEILNAVKHEPLINTPGTKYVYSDLGFILLGQIVQQVTGERLDQFAREEFYYPLGMQSTFFNPKKNASWLVSRIPPTENDTTYRHKLMHAEVHDERAWYLDGVAGHAGLFSSAGDLAIYTQMLMNGGTYAGKRYLSADVVHSFTKKESGINNRGYGFDHKSASGFSTAGSLSSADTYGHLGFTGTSFWIDPEKKMAIIILTNRVYPYRSYGKHINQVRANVADAVMSSIIKP